MTRRYFQYKNSYIEKGDLSKTKVRLFSYIDALIETVKANDRSSEESFLNVPADEHSFRDTMRMIKIKSSEKLDCVVVVGIGGSNLGTKALASALSNSRKIFFADAIEPADIDEIHSYLKEIYSKDKHCLLVLASKSGRTTESIVNFGVLLELLKKIDHKWREHVVVISDKGSKLIYYANSSGFDYLTIPPNVEGRYSVFTPSGLFPLGMIGIDIKKLLRGARNITKICLTTKMNNPAFMDAGAVFYNRRPITNLFVFSKKLFDLAMWWRQLMGESLGKSGMGTTPIVSVGSADMHSVGQLYLDGKRDKYTTFVSLTREKSDILIPKNKDLEVLVSGISNKNMSDVSSAILSGVKKAYDKKKLPYSSIEFDRVDEESLGAAMQFYMIEVIYLAKLMGVNAFNQPAVELYKSEARKILGR